MAYIIDHTYVNDPAATSITAVLPNHTTNDLLIAYFCKDGATGTFTTPSGYTQIFNGTSHAAFWKVAGASESAPSSGTGVSDEYVAQMVSVRDVDTTTPIDTSRQDAATNTQHTSTAVTTTNNDTLILYLFTGDNSKEPCIQPGPVALRFAESTVDAGIAWTFQKTAGTAPTVTINKQSSDDGDIGTIAINSSGTPIIPPICDPDSPPFDIISYGTDSAGPFGGGAADPSAHFSTINGITYGYDAITSSAGVRPFYYYSAGLSQHNVSSQISGGIWTCTSVDLSGKRICSHISTQSATYYLRLPDVSDTSIVFGLRSGGNDYRFWHVSAKNSKPNPSAQHVVIIDVDDTDFIIEDVGTFDSTDVDGIFFGVNNTGAGEQRAIFSTVASLNAATLTLGSSTLPAKLETIQDFTLSAGALTFQNQNAQSSKQWLSFQDIQIGNGSDPVYFVDSGVSLEFPEKRDETNNLLSYNVDDDVATITMYGVSGDTIKLTDSTVTSVTPYNFSIHASSTNAATWDFSGLIVVNANVTLRDIFSTGASAITFRNCPSFTLNSADLSGGCLFDNTLVTITSETDLDKVNNCEFKNRDGAGESAILITGNQTGTWTDPNLTVSNNTYDIEYSGTTNFTIESATSLTVNNSSSGVLTIDTPSVTLTVNSSESSSDIKIFNTNTQTIEASATGTTASTTTAATYDWTVQKAGFLPQRGTGVVLGASSVTVDVTLVEDPVYSASHGLTFTTDYSYNASTRVMTIVANQEGRDLYSAMIDDFISETALRNCPFPLVAVGPDRIDFTAVGYYNTATTVGATIDAGDITFWKGAGMEWEHDTTGNPTKKFYSIKSSNTLQASSVVGYTQVNNGTPSECTLVSNKVNEVIQFFEDADGNGTPDYNYTGHLLFKGFKTGYYQARWDVINDGGVTTLEPYEYNIALLQDAIAGTSGDQTITITTLTDHTGAPLSVGGKSFDYELVDPGTNDADALLAQVNYDIFNAVDTSISGTLYTSYQAFDLPDLIVEAGSNIETERGYFEGDGAVTDLSGVYLSRSAADHPGIARFQSNDGTYYTPAVTANISITGMPTAGGSIRLQLHNETAKSASAWAGTTVYAQGDKVLRSTGVGSESTAGLYFVATTGGTSGASEPTWDTTVGNTTADGTVTWTCYAILYYDADPGASGYSDTYTNLEEFSANDTYRVRFAELNSTTSFKTFETTGLATADGITVAVSVDSDSVYAANAIDGSSAAVTGKFTADYANDQIDLDANQDFAVTEAFAYYCYELTTSQGMNEFWGGVTAIDSANYRNNTAVVSIYFDETAGFVKQTDSARWYRDDDTRPVIDPTTGGAGLELNWRNPVYQLETGVSGLTGSESTELFKNSTILTNLATVDTVVDSIQTDTTAILADTADMQPKLGTPAGTDMSADIAAIKSDTAATLTDTGTTIPATLTTIEGKVDTIDANVDAVLIDTGTTLPSQISGVETKIDTVDVNVDGIKAKTDSLTFTQGGNVDANVQYVNDIEVSGTGEDNDPWNPV